MSDIPRTPPRRGFSPQLWTPSTPRYAPIDEPDRFSKIGRQQGTQSPKKDSMHTVPASLQNNAKAQLLCASKVSALTLPLTPEQTPVNRKKKNLDLITRTTVSLGTLGTSGRILFPASSPAKGTGRSYKRHTETQESTKLAKSLDTFPHTSHVSPARPRIEEELRARTIPRPSKSLDACPSTSYVSPYRPVVANPKQKVNKAAPITSPPSAPKLVIFDDAKAFKAEINEDPFLGPSRGPRGRRRKASTDLRESPSKKPALDLHARHPHDTEIDPSVPGMWYNFRGKKVFRPYPGGVSPFDGYEPRVLFGPRRDSKSLEMSCTPIPKRKAQTPPIEVEEEDDVDMLNTPTKALDPFTARLMQSVSKTRGRERVRASTPEIDSDEEDATDREDNFDEPQVVTATTTTTTIQRRQFARPVSRTPARDGTKSTKKHFFR